MDEATAPKHEYDNQLVIIEPAGPEDAEAILKIKRDAWLQTYPNEQHGVTREDIAKQFTDTDMRQAISNWQNAIASEADQGLKRTFVARFNGNVVGYTSPDIEDGKRKLGAMYVAPDAQGNGVGGKLLKQAIEWHGRDNDIYLSVVRYNDRAIAFYEHFGFHKTGVELPEEVDDKGLKLLPEIEMILKAKS